jgi:hypothetical protein
MVTLSELSRESGIPARTLRWRCRELGLPKVGHIYALDLESATKVLNYDLFVQEERERERRRKAKRRERYLKTGK